MSLKTDHAYEATTLPAHNLKMYNHIAFNTQLTYTFAEPLDINLSRVLKNASVRSSL